MPIDATGSGIGRPSTVLSAVVAADTGFAMLASPRTIAETTPTTIAPMIPNSAPATSASAIAPRMQYQGTLTLLLAVGGSTTGVSIPFASHVKRTVALKVGAAVQQKPEAEPVPLIRTPLPPGGTS